MTQQVFAYELTENDTAIIERASEKIGTDEAKRDAFGIKIAKQLPKFDLEGRPYAMLFSLASSLGFEAKRRAVSQDAMIRYKKKSKEVYTKEIQENGLDPNFPAYKLQQRYDILWTGAFVWHFDKPELVDPENVRSLIVRINRGKSSLQTTWVSFTVNNFFAPYASFDIDDGKMKIYLMGEDGKKTYLKVNGTDLQTFWVSFEYLTNFNSKISFVMDYHSPTELKKILAKWKYIGVEWTDFSAFHTDKQSFDFKIPFKVVVE